MKKILLSLIIIACFHTSIKAQWTIINSGTSAKLDAIHFIDSQNGFCSGGFVNILHTTNSGSNWNMSSTTGYRDFDFISNSIGYAASISGNSMGKTSDGGLTWTSINPPTSNSLCGVSATGPSTAYFVGTGGVLWKTNNGGASFTVLNSGVSTLLTDIVFINTTTGFILSQAIGIRKTTDSGNSWATVYSNTSGLFTEMCFVNANVGYAVGSEGKVVKTIDAGLTWSVLTTNSTSYLQGVHFFDINNGIVVGTGGVILVTNDGGANWNIQNSGSTENLYDVRMFSANSAIVTGDNGTILKNDNIVLGVQENKTSFSIQFYPNPTSSQLTIITNDNIISRIDILDMSGKIVKTEKTSFTNINVSDLSSGIYFIKVNINDNILIKKFIKR